VRVGAPAAAYRTILAAVRPLPRSAAAAATAAAAAAAAAAAGASQLLNRKQNAVRLPAQVLERLAASNTSHNNSHKQSIRYASH
jgi:hypothetical protein